MAINEPILIQQNRWKFAIRGLFPAVLLYVIRPRLERGTVCLEGRCSIQLSYRTDLCDTVKLQTLPEMTVLLRVQMYGFKMSSATLGTILLVDEALACHLGWLFLAENAEHGGSYVCQSAICYVCILVVGYVDAGHGVERVGGVGSAVGVDGVVGVAVVGDDYSFVA